MPNSEVVSFEIDPSPALSAQNAINAGQEATEKKITDSVRRINSAHQSQGENVIRITDRSRNSIDRLVQSVEKQAAAYGKTGVERLIVQRDQYIAKLGGEQQAIDRVTASYAKMIAAENSQGSGFQGYADKVKSFMQDPLTAVEGSLGKIASMGGAVGVIGGIALGLGSIAIAGYEAAKSLGEYGVQVRDVEIRTGLTSKEVGQFGFAAKAAGSDVTVFERGMRGLTAALEDNSSAGDKARKALKGISLRDSSGELKSTSEIFLGIADHLNGITDTFKRNQEGMAIFKKGWLELSPVMAELSENVKKAKAADFGLSEADVARFVKYKQQVTEVETLWERVGRKIKEGIAGTIWINLKGAGAKFALALMGQTDDTSAANTGRVSSFAGGLGGGEFQGNPNAARYGVLPGGENYLDIAAVNRRRMESATAEGTIRKEANQSIAAQAGVRSFIETGGGLEAQQEKLSKLKTQLDEARVSASNLTQAEYLSPSVVKEHTSEVTKLSAEYQRQSDIVKEMGKSEAHRLAILEQIRKIVAEGGTAVTLGTGETAKAVQTQGPNDYVLPFPKSSHAPSLFGTGGSMNALSVEEYKGGIQDVPTSPGLESGLDRFGNVSQRQVADSRLERVFVSPTSERKPLGSEIAAGADRLKGEEERRKQDDAIHLAAINAESNATIKLLELRRGDRGEIQTAKDVAALREGALQQEFDITKDIAKYREASLNNQLDLTVKIEEIQERQIDEVKKASEGLFHTLFTNPSGFGKQLGNTLRDAILKPIESGLSDIVAGPINQVIHGENGEGGIAGFFRGIFGGSKSNDPIKTTAINTGNTVDVLKQIRDLLGGGGSGPGGSTGGSSPTSSPGRFGRLALGLGLGGMLASGATPPFFPRSFSGSAAAESFTSGGGSSTAGLSQLSSGLWDRTGSAALPSFGSTDLNGLPLSAVTPPFAGGSIPGLGGGSGSSGGGIGGALGGGVKGILGSLNQFVGGAFHPGNTVGLAQNLSQLGHSNAALLGGGLLAYDGLRRGGTVGTLEDTAGGALIGFKYGGPIGAAIGAGIGLGAGLLRQFVFKGDKQHTKDLVKDIYQIKINDATADQIIKIAKEKYNGQISIAVRSQEVRDLIALYSQTFGLSQQSQFAGDTVHGASLVQAGGRLQQQAQYVNGAAYTYSSGIPNYNGIGSSSLPTSARSLASVPVSVYVSPEATTQLWRTGTASAIQDNPRMVAASAIGGYSQSAGRGSNTTLALSPSAILQ